MEGESAVQAVHGPAIEAAARRSGDAPTPRSQRVVDEMRADYEHQLDARYAAARGFVDAIVYPEETRDVLAHGAPRRAPQSGPAPRRLRASRQHLDETSTSEPHDGRRIVRVAAVRASGATGSRRRAGRSRAGRSTT